MGKGGLDKKMPTATWQGSDLGLGWEGKLNNGRKGGCKEVGFKSRRYTRSVDKYIHGTHEEMLAWRYNNNDIWPYSVEQKSSC